MGKDKRRTDEENGAMASYVTMKRKEVFRDKDLVPHRKYFYGWIDEAYRKICPNKLPKKLDTQVCLPIFMKMGFKDPFTQIPGIYHRKLKPKTEIADGATVPTNPPPASDDQKLSDTVSTQDQPKLPESKYDEASVVASFEAHFRTLSTVPNLHVFVDCMRRLERLLPPELRSVSKKEAQAMVDDAIEAIKKETQTKVDTALTVAGEFVADTLNNVPEKMLESFIKENPAWTKLVKFSENLAG